METETLKRTGNTEDAVCCPPFEAALWDNKMHMWDHKMFIHDSVRTFFYMPLSFGKVMRRLSKKVESAGADMPDWICLSDHTSKWNMDIYLEVDKEVPEANNVIISGNFYSKVYEGPYKDTGKWTIDFANSLREKGLTMKKSYIWYTTCPKCSKKYGKNYTVIIGDVSG